ncbi:hypothetical protein CEP54_009787 [Fusarium duplospermum]|uniref:Uncharacterized protein n=1 Tax=Fusarium duplospermum TaxID=1325734 RepID=A0A428PNL9_9HYPO|nr:hypothetical protein CEP54_009787 [Fusarium duplospermum]
MQSVSLFLLALCSASFAAECFNDQKRTTTIPTADQIRAEITSLSWLENICRDIWQPGDDNQLEKTFEHGYLHLNAQRANSSVPLAYCMGAFGDIMAQCIEGAGLWGGFWTLDGEVYNISNSNYPHNPLLPGDDGGPGSSKPKRSHCSYSKQNPATFVDSGAAQYLQDSLATNDDWFFTMERATTNGQGTVEEPSCGVIEEANCSPSKDCRVFTPPEFYYIRVVSGLVTRAHEKLQDETIRNILAIDGIIADFKPDPADTVDPNIFNTMAGALAMAGAVAGAAPGPAEVILNLFGGVMTIVGANVPAPEVLDIEAVHSQASVYLGTIFDETRKSMADLLARLFSNRDVEYSLSDLMGESEPMDLTGSLTEGVRFMNEGLVGVTLKAMGYLVMMIKNFSESKCSEIEGAKFIDNYCYAVSTGSRGLSYKFMGAEDIKLLPEKYGIDMVEFLKNVHECSTLGDGIGVGSLTAYPACFFNLDLALHIS